MKKTEKEKLRSKIIDEGIRQGLSANEILRQLKKHEVGMQRKVGLAEIRKRKGKRKKPHAGKHIPKKYRKRIVIINKFLTRYFYQDDFVEEDIIDIDIPIKGIYDRIEEYDFEEHTRYDEIVVDLDIVEDKKDERRLTFDKLKCIFNAIFEKNEDGKFKFIRLRYDEIVDIVNMMWRIFRQENIEYRKRNFSTLGNIRKILLKKGV